MSRPISRPLAAKRRAQDPAEHEDDDALADAESEEGRLEAARRDHVRDRDDGERRAGAEAGGGQAGGEAAAVGEPFERVSDAGAVDRAGADAAGRGGDV